MDNTVSQDLKKGSLLLWLEPCITGYTKMAYEAGTTEDELVEFLNVAITESGCPGEQWAMVALKTYGDLKAGKKIDAADICCHNENLN